MSHKSTHGGEAKPSFIVVTKPVSEARNPARTQTVQNLLRSDEFAEFLPKDDPFTNGELIDSCAVVGNAASLLDGGWGKRIDVSVRL